MSYFEHIMNNWFVFNILSLMVEHRVVPIDDSIVSEISPVADAFDDSKTIIIVITIVREKYTRRPS